MEEASAVYKVLIIEDEFYMREWLRTRIHWEMLDLELVDVASDGIEGMELFQSHEVDIIITDLSMPRMDGMDLIEAIRKENARVRFIILTCLEEFQYARAAVSMDVTDYILKVSSDVQKVEAILSKAIAQLREFPVSEGGNNSLQKTDGESSEEANRGRPLFIQCALNYIKENYAKDISIEDVAEHVGMSASYLSRQISKTEGKSFILLLNSIRIETAKSLLNNPQIKIHEIARMVGFAKTSYFIHVFKKHYGITPGEYRRKNNQL